ncbi:uncharacterized protein LOC131577072 [Poecile atricapillus]|uniref:uncharacterized protein LOC131577072 n=1 Tax=Poecile atricapillus TaxID=48891 RepID=UPI00273A02E3|nr:uncharacterized protein LOC131577072 [Poecile atricapillus]
MPRGARSGPAEPAPPGTCCAAPSGGSAGPRPLRLPRRSAPQHGGGGGGGGGRCPRPGSAAAGTGLSEADGWVAVPCGAAPGAVPGSPNSAAVRGCRHRAFAIRFPALFQSYPYSMLKSRGVCSAQAKLPDEDSSSTWEQVTAPLVLSMGSVSRWDPHASAEGAGTGS